MTEKIEISKSELELLRKAITLALICIDTENQPPQFSVNDVIPIILKADALLSSKTE